LKQSRKLALLRSLRPPFLQRANSWFSGLRLFRSLRPTCSFWSQAAEKSKLVKILVVNTRLAPKSQAVGRKNPGSVCFLKDGFASCNTKVLDYPQLATKILPYFALHFAFHFAPPCSSSQGKWSRKAKEVAKQKPQLATGRKNLCGEVTNWN
jgi:hypothetical protein